jgi:carnitine 3-dehydrogenase
MSDARPRRVGLLGGGVIGAGWAARFLLNGSDVRLYDPDPETGRKVGEVLANARHAAGLLLRAPLPAEGRLELAATPEEAVEGADFVQESAPEREDLKRDLLGRASRAAAPDVVFGSSTSGLLPSRLQLDMERPERLCVGHPFNPVYLLPLVEVLGGAATSRDAVERAAAVYRDAGMHPLLLDHEIDGFVADRLLESMWREALWLIADGTATVSQVDEAMAYGPGLRFAAMGTFLTYRIAGGEAGIRHFMAQFGPSLKWPWSRLTDVPELDEALLDRLGEQSDAQASGRSLRELERLRDDSLIAILTALRERDATAGAVIAAHERALARRAGTAATRAVVADGGGAARLLEEAVAAELRALAAGGPLVERECRRRVIAEPDAGESLDLASRVTHADGVVHVTLELRRAGVIAATAEHVFRSLAGASDRYV